ncbi:MAG TPA: hypothetical protein VHA33_24520 [Candidatus Angelobacter sp.]|jgi:hypothetical protein|nr:hypothetical protein [Candidatus Angelobacter sp.]
MTILLVLVACGLIASTAVLWAFRSVHAPALSELEKHIQPVDLAILANLLDPQQEQYLKKNLKTKQFIRYKLMRLSVARYYMARASRNAAVLMNVGRVAARSQNPGMSNAGRALAEAALRLRIYAAFAPVMLALQLVVPNPRRSFTSFVDGYNRMKHSVAQLTDLEAPFQSDVVLRSL